METKERLKLVLRGQSLQVEVVDKLTELAKQNTCIIAELMTDDPQEVRILQYIAQRAVEATVLALTHYLKPNVQSP